jgi:hypothetical protein
MTFEQGNTGTLLVGVGSTSNAAEILAVPLTRGAGGHITGFGTPTPVADAPGLTGPNQGGIDGGLAYVPGSSTLLYSSYPDNSIGELKSLNSTTPPGPAKLVALPSLGSSADCTMPGADCSTGGLQFVPSGFAGAGSLKISSFDGSAFFTASAVNDGSGMNTFNIDGVAQTASFATGAGPEGFVYVHAGNPDFTADSIVLSEESNNVVATYQINSSGDPIVSTRQILVSGANHADGMAIDPVTGDIIFDDFDLGNFFEIRGTMTSVVPAPTPLITICAGLIPGAAMLGRRKWATKRRSGGERRTL